MLCFTFKQAYLRIPLVMSRPRASEQGSQTFEKRARLTSLRKRSYVSQSGIERLLTAIRDDGLPAAFNKRTQYTARKTLASQPTPYGRLVNE